MPIVPLAQLALIKNASFINNEWITSAAHGFDVLNPATGQSIITVGSATEVETTAAIAAAKEAFSTWRSLTAKQRSAHLKNWFSLIVANRQDLAKILTSEQGKPLHEALAEVDYGASFVEWFAEECRRVNGEIIPAPVGDRRMMTIKQPVGVVAAITPWNFPIAMITRKIAPAIAAGCTVVLKPSSLTPLSALALAHLAKEAGIPAGVLNIIVSADSAAVGKVLTQHPDVSKISFTGSTETGRVLARDAAATVKKLSLELGGNAPVIVFDDADVEEAVRGTMASKYRNAGQTCVCANRIFVQKGIYDQFIQRYCEAVAALKVGNGMEEGVNIGPLINNKAAEKVTALVSDAIAKGASIVYRQQLEYENPRYFPPTIVSNCKMNMDISHEEIFGPVSTIFTFETIDEVVAMANDTIYGLAAYFFTKDVNKAWRVAEKLDYGIIGINEGIVSFAEAPFGGIKQSGYGKEGSHYGIEEYLVTKYVCFGGIYG